MFEVPSRDGLLAATTPEALFGAALSDGRALRTAYAALVRAFDAETDPEAFGHARRLYEAARARVAEGPSEPVADPLPRTPSAQLSAALEARDPVQVLDVLTAHQSVLVAAPRGARRGSSPRASAGSPCGRAARRAAARSSCAGRRSSARR